MTQDLKRLNAPKSWPVPRKSNVWVTSPNPGPHSLDGCMPLSVVLRDMLKVVDTAAEAKKVLWHLPGLAYIVATVSQPIYMVVITLVASLLVVWSFWPRKQV